MGGPIRNRHEAEQVAYNETGSRTLVQIGESGGYKPTDSPSPLNSAREEIMKFIENHRGRIILPCHGDCFRHADGVVAWCHSKLRREYGTQTQPKTDEKNPRQP